VCSTFEAKSNIREVDLALLAKEFNDPINHGFNRSAGLAGRCR
jgi:hypothetical protein